VKRCAILLVLASGCRSEQPPQVGANSRHLPVAVVLNATDVDFPVEWLSQYGGKYSPMPEVEQEQTVAAIADAMGKYPSALLTSYLKSVVTVGWMEFGGNRMAGTNSDDTLYMANSGDWAGYSDDFLRRTFHHELSSILLRQRPELMDERAWRALNKPTFRYSYEGDQMYDSFDADTSYRREMHELGFLCSYGRTSIEEDFNTFAEGLFSGDPAFWDAVDSYVSVRKKCDLAFDFYSKLDPQFSESFFRGLVKK
jgi:hypothetical protein